MQIILCDMSFKRRGTVPRASFLYFFFFLDFNQSFQCINSELVSTFSRIFFFFAASSHFSSYGNQGHYIPIRDISRRLAAHRLLSPSQQSVGLTLPWQERHTPPLPPRHVPNISRIRTSCCSTHVSLASFISSGILLRPPRFSQLVVVVLLSGCVPKGRRCTVHDLLASPWGTGGAGW